MPIPVYTREQHFYHYNQGAYEVGGMARWRWQVQTPGGEIKEVECRLYIQKGSAWPGDEQTENDKFYVMFGQAPGSNVATHGPDDPQPVPDCQDQWWQLTDLPYTWWEHDVMFADFHPNGTSSGFQKPPFGTKCFEADFDATNCNNSSTPVIPGIRDL